MKPSVDLDKRVYSLVKDNPLLINLTKAAKVSLEMRWPFNCLRCPAHKAHGFIHGQRDLEPIYGFSQACLD